MGGGPSKTIGTRFSAVLDKDHTKTADATETATFAAGCFWGIELAFQRVPGVTKTEVGYTGGSKASPTYEQVCSGTTGHAEAIQMKFDPKVVSYKELLDVFWEVHDPTTMNRQGNDVGTQYRSAIFFHTNDQRDQAFESLEAEEKRIGKKIVTEIEPSTEWWPAEAGHQQYLEKGGQCSRKGDKTAIRCYG